MKFGVASGVQVDEVKESAIRKGKEEKKGRQGEGKAGERTEREGDE